MTDGLETGKLEISVRHDVSNLVIAELARFVHGRAGDAGVNHMLALANGRLPGGAVGDDRRWTSHNRAVALFDAAAVITAERSVGVRVGTQTLGRYVATKTTGWLDAVGSPAALLRTVAESFGQFIAGYRVDAVEVENSYALIRVTAQPGPDCHPHLCAFAKGLFSQVPSCFGLAPALVTESECQARGGRFCLYAIAWQAARRVPAAVPQPARSPRSQSPVRQSPVRQSPTPEERSGGPSVSRSPVGQVGEVDERLEGVFATASELLSEEDIDTLLARITARAAHAVSAPQYLLVVRTAPDAPPQLHHHGFNSSEAQALAHELWQEHPDNAGGSRLIVDIASARRRYGRLAAVFPAGVRYFESERRILALYAGYAATALDVVTSLEDARRSDATARALLDFSGALSRVTTAQDVAQLLADTAPTVTGCQQATVMLWDDERQCLVLRSRTGQTATGEPTVAGASQTVRPTSESASGFSLAPSDTPLLDQMITSRTIATVDRTTADPFLAGLLVRSGIADAVVAPLFAGDEFLGVVSANFVGAIGSTGVHAPDLHERLSGLVDQTATSLQNARLLEQISHMAWYDVLTGLPNRRLLEDRVEQELARVRRDGGSVCMFFVDLDRFKAVNDTMGHAAGDELIRQVAQRLRDTVRRQDTVARLGGDEFAVLVPGLSDPTTIEHLVHRSLDALAQPYHVLGREVRTSASIGVAMTPLHGESYDELLSRADEAMYRSKRLGGNTSQVYSHTMRSATDTLDLERDLLVALERDEFFILYQPSINLETNQVVGVEALVRWRHEIRGILDPQVFIPLAEESDIIVALDAWVLEEACRQVSRWSTRHALPLRLSVNIASRDLVHTEFYDTVRRILTRTGVDPSMLELEIAGRVVLDDTGRAHATIDRLRSLGVRFSIDDFGSGNSSMSRIQSLPVDTLKIDPSFVQILGPDRDDSLLIAAIISMAHVLGLDCAAEGVETVHQRRALVRGGCTTAQGYYFSPPLLPGGLERLLDSHRPGPDDRRDASQS